MIVSEPITADPGRLGLVTRMGHRGRLKLIAPDQGAPARSTLADASIRVLTAAGQRLVRASYRALLERDERIEVVGEAASEPPPNQALGRGKRLAIHRRRNSLLADSFDSLLSRR